MRIIRAGSVFDGAALRPDSEVLIGDGGRIVEVRRVQPPPDGTEVVDHGPETTLLPGLVDGHQHLSWGCTPNAVIGIPGDPAAQRANAMANARQALAAEVTTIQDLGDSDCAVVDARDGATNLPLHGFSQNQLRLAVVCLAVELTAWLQMLALTDHPARRWEPKRLRLRLFSIAGRLVRHVRARRLRLSAHAPWRHLIETALTRLKALPAPG